MLRATVLQLFNTFFLLSLFSSLVWTLNFMNNPSSSENVLTVSSEAGRPFVLWFYSRNIFTRSVSFCVFAACPVGYFKSVSGSVPCSVCPPNSRTSQEGSNVCECRSSFYRAATDANSSACTSELCFSVCLLMPGSLGGVGLWSHLSLTQPVRIKIHNDWAKLIFSYGNFTL